MPSSTDTEVRILYYVVFISLCTLAFGIPLFSHLQPLDKLHRNGFTVIHKNKTKKVYNNPARTKWHQPSKTSQSTNTENYTRNPNYVSKDDTKRGVDIGLQIKLPSTPQTQVVKDSNDLDKLEDFLKKALGIQSGLVNSSLCPKCEEEEGSEYAAPEKRRVKPAYECDEWDAKYRVCILERNIGDTVTFYLSTGMVDGHKPTVTWKREFHMQDSETRREFLISPDYSSENIIIGKQGFELRVSPITEIDVGYNLFSALLNGHTSAQSKVYFMIRIVPIDLGFVYVGESIELNLRGYVSLPAESLSFKWYMEKNGERSTLPSNMRTSASGSSIRISELRQEQEGILACSVYTNLNFLATKKRFLIKDLVKNNDVLVLPPDHNLRFEEQLQERDKRLPKKSTKHKREIDLDEIFEKAMMESTTTTESNSMARTDHRITTPDVVTHTYDDYNLGMDFENGESTVKHEEDPVGDLYDPGKGYEESNEDGSRNLLEEQQAGVARENNLVNAEHIGENDPAIKNFQGSNGVEHQETSAKQKFGNTGMLNNNFEGPSNEMYANENKQLNGHDTSVNHKTITHKFSAENDFDINLNNKKSYGAPVGESEIILNVDKIPRPRKISAEEKIASLISSCYSDFECSETATCTSNSPRQRGYCRCLPGYYGVGIFCREDIWISKSNIDLQEIENPADFFTYSGILHEMQETNDNTD